MWEIALKIVGALLALFGLSELLYELWVWMTVPRKCRQKQVLLVLQEENAEEQLRYIRLASRWWGGLFAERIILLSDALSPAYAAACQQVCEQNQYVFCSAKALPELLMPPKDT